MLYTNDKTIGLLLQECKDLFILVRQLISVCLLPKVSSKTGNSKFELLVVIVVINVIHFM